MRQWASFTGGWLPGLHLAWLSLSLGCFFAPLAGRGQEPGVVVPAPAPVLQGLLADPGFRLKASEPGGVERFLGEESGISEADMQAGYDWLRGRVKGVSDQALECRVLAWLARQLKRPSGELLKADDLLLQATPDIAEGWLNRAEFYSDAKDPEKAGWAVDMYLQALQRVNFAASDWHKVLRDPPGADWLELTVKAGKFAAWTDAFVNALRNTPRGEARLGTSARILDFLNEEGVKSQPAVIESLLDTLVDVQPQVPLGAVSRFIETARAYDSAGQPEVAKRIARMLIVAPVPKEAAEKDAAQAPADAKAAANPPESNPVRSDSLATAQREIAQEQADARHEQAQAVRSGYHTLQFCWENTLPRYQPNTIARYVLGAALGDDGPAFAQQALAAAKDQPWNDDLISHALLGEALADGLKEEDLALAAGLSVTARGRIAQRLCAFATPGHYPLHALTPWLEDGAQELIRQSQGKPVERAFFDSLLLTMDWLERAGEAERLRRLLRTSLETPPRALDTNHWERLSQLILRHGSDTELREFAKAWDHALAHAPVEREHLIPLADAAVRGGVGRGADFAAAAYDIWKRQYAGDSPRVTPDPEAASKVAEALLACDDMEDFSDFVEGLEKLSESRGLVFHRMADELADLQDLLLGNGDRLPAVDAWVQGPEGSDKSTRVQWQFVLPELGTPGASGAPLRIVQRNIGTPIPNSMIAAGDARWWAAGAAHPLLQRLSGRFDLEILAGDSPDKLRVVANVDGAGAKGAAETPNLPPAGCCRVMLNSRVSGAVQFGEPRYYSIRSPLFATGREPDATQEANLSVAKLEALPPPAVWQKEDTERWGRLVTAPIPIEEGAEYLLTDWPVHPSPVGNTTGENPDPPLQVRLILLDEKKRPLGPVPVASTGYALDGIGGSPTRYPVHRAHSQLFRPSDWAGDGDLVRPREITDTDGVARYMAFVTRAPGDGPLPLLQLRPHREYLPGSDAHPSSDSTAPQMPELNGEFIAAVGFRPTAWHVTMATDRGLFTGKGALVGFDVARIPWKPLVRVESDLLEGTEWPMVFQAKQAMVVEPPWSGTRNLGLRLVPLDASGQNYEACERRDLPLPTYDRGEISPRGDGALLMVSSRRSDKPEPVAAWIEPDGSCSVVPLPRPPLTGNPGLILAWWGPEEKFTLYEDGILFHMQHLNGLHLLKAEPGSPDDIPEGAERGKSFEKPRWTLERREILAEHDTNTGRIVRRFHLAQPCEGKPMSFHHTSPVMLFTTEHDIIRVNPPPMK